MSSKAIGVVWFSGRSTIGIAIGFDEEEQKSKAWIASVHGENEDADIQQILDWGSKFPLAEASMLVLKLGKILDTELWDNLFSVNNKIGKGSDQDSST